MASETGKVVVLGGTGFIGRRFIAEGLRQGWSISGLARSAEAERTLTDLGAAVIRGSADDVGGWAQALDGARLVVDLIQPARPKRLGRSQMHAISKQRLFFTKSLLKSLGTLAVARRPRLISVSGIDDLAPDADGFLSARSSLAREERGFNAVGLPVRKAIEASGLAASFVYLASVYGPGGPFANAIFPAIKAGKWRDFGTAQDRMLLVHVDDVARSLVRIGALDQGAATGRSFVIADTNPVTMASFSALAAAQLDVPKPARAPTWLAALIAGRPIVETTLHRHAAKNTLLEQGGFGLKYPSFEEGVPPTLRELRLSN